MKTNIEDIRNRIKAAAESCERRPESIQLVAVSKTVPVERVKAAVVEGINIMGEN